jgi:hypothetical protein
MIKLPASPNDKKERTEPVRNNKGEAALIPVSWLADKSMRGKLDTREHPGSFTPLINFSETFENNEN